MVLYGVGEVQGDAAANIAVIEDWAARGKVDAYTSTFSTRKAVINGEFDYALLADFGYTPDLTWGDFGQGSVETGTR